ncbi:MAG: hypothetical protein ACFB20_04865 [Opitutales bacterium]
MNWEPKHEEPIRLPKWPFYLANALLVVAASAIAFTSTAPLSPWALIGIILFVGLGFVLSPLPHVIEFTTRLRSDELAHAHLERSNAQRSEASLLALQEATERLNQQSHRFEQLHGSMAKAQKDLESRLSALEEAVKGLDTTGEDLRALLTDRDDGVRSPAIPADSALTKKAQSALEAATAQMQSAAAVLQRVERVEGLVTRLEALPLVDGPASFRESSPKPAAHAVSAESISAPEREPVSAFATEPAPSTAANPSQDVALETTPAEASEEAAVPVESSAQAPILSEPEPKPAAVNPSVTSEANPSEAETTATVDPAEASEAPAAQPEPAIDSVQASPAQSELLATPEPPAPAKRKRAKRKRAAKKVARVDDSAPGLVANVLIGIGNVPYIRGEGPGLSPDKGIAMDFVEIGKWRWSPPEGTESNGEPITCRIFKNDAIPADGDPIAWTPGERLEVNLRFPK